MPRWFRFTFASPTRMSVPFLALACLLHASVKNSFFVSAHLPLTTRPSCGIDYGSSGTALPVADPTISWSFRHYLDCSRRAVWIRLFAPTGNPEYELYVGVGVPTLDRMSNLRADAVVIGPGLPSWTEEQKSAYLPTEVADDAVWTSRDDIGAIFFRGPEDQSTCDHLGNVMSNTSTVRNGRCDFFEPFGSTHSWRVLDQEGVDLPIEGEEYYIAVFLQEHTSGKISIALGTWIEDFLSDILVDTPNCALDLSDFHEKEGERPDDFPVVECSADAPNGTTSVASTADTYGGGEKVCDLGQVCDDPDNCTVAGFSYEEPVMGACGGGSCPAAVRLWEEANMKMHRGMAIEYTGNVQVDFVRGMIPHHVGALDMCRILVQNLTCAEVSNIDSLDGLVQFCMHTKTKQEAEIGSMREWLSTRGHDEEALCSTIAMGRMADVNGDQMKSRAEVSGGEGMVHVSHDNVQNGMSTGCGNVTAPFSVTLARANEKMYAAMAVNYSCNHLVDFARMMIPHHAGGVLMCEELIEFLDGQEMDPLISELCLNITTIQRAEVAWLHRWLEARGHSAYAPCALESGTCPDGSAPIPPPEEAPCEDMLSESGLCPALKEDKYCRCEAALDTVLKCEDGNTTVVQGFGVFDAAVECPRSCGLCQGERADLLYLPCSRNDSHNVDGDKQDNENSNDACGARRSWHLWPVLIVVKFYAALWLSL